MKGESSGHTQRVLDIAFDCDGDTLLIQVDQSGVACHEGYHSCFYRSAADQGREVRVTEPRRLNPDQIYGQR
jgi:phosphoribosyl-AMP cyclohydrolase